MACPFRAASVGEFAKEYSRAESVGVAIRLAEGVGPINYGDYLQIGKILDAQAPRSVSLRGEMAHDEMLFIIIHQVYELWFKEVLHELESIRGLFKTIPLEDHLMLRIVQRLRRVEEILKICVAQWRVLETMTPQGFMEFRDLLAPASGFQSAQWRLVENTLGVLPELRLKYHGEPYTVALKPEDAERVTASEHEPSLLRLVEAWLERTPGLDGPFWGQFEHNVRGSLAQQRAAAEAVADEKTRQADLESCATNEATFDTLFDKARHDALVAKGDRRLSHRATKAAMIITIHRDLPGFNLPSSLLSLLQDIDTQVMNWRLAHVMMVQRVLGTKMGTGGSSGYQYLRATLSDRYKVFIDLFNLATFLVPSTIVPPLDAATIAGLQHHPPATH